MNNASWVCFDCRRVARRSIDFDGDVSCPDCGARCRPIGDRVPVPPRENVRAWDAMRELMDEMDRELRD